MNTQERAYLIDAPIIFFRYFFSLPDHWQSECGQATSSVYGFTHWLIRFLREQNPTYVSACFDCSLGTCFRNDIYSDYKKSRPLPDDNIAFQFAACRQVCELLGVPTYASARYEADDLIGTLLMRHRQKGRPSTIISRDKDLGQLLRDGDFLWFFPDGEQIGVDHFYRQFGVQPQQMPDFLALCGDAGDDIPGVPGIGPKTAAALLERFDSIENLAANLNNLACSKIRGAARIQNLLAQYGDQINMAKKLATIDCKAKFDRRVRLNRKTLFRRNPLLEYCETLGFSVAKAVEKLEVQSEHYENCCR